MMPPNTLRAYRLLLSGVTVWCALILFTPLLSAFGFSHSAACYRFFRPICHQDPARSFFILGMQFPVCIRCLSIYGSFLIGFALWPATRRVVNLPTRLLAMAAITPMILDVFLDSTGIHSSTTVLRLVTGGIFGFVAVSFLAKPMTDALSQLFSYVSEYRIRHEPQT